MDKSVFVIGGRRCTIYRNKEKGPVLYWGTGANDDLEAAAQRLYELKNQPPWMLVVFEAADWNADFSPWPAPAVFGTADFAGHAHGTLAWLTEQCIPALEADEKAVRGIGGYSLAGLFSLWAFFQSKYFCGAASCSGSLWYPGWQEWVQRHAVPDKSCVYLSLGKREEHTRNRMMSAVGDATRWLDQYLQKSAGVQNHVLTWHAGGHFSDVEERIVQAMIWLISTMQRL